MGRHSLVIGYGLVAIGIVLIFTGSPWVGAFIVVLGLVTGDF